MVNPVSQELAVARKLKVFTSRENVAMSREALREVLAEGRVVLRPDVANARFEGSLVLSHEEFIEQKQIDIKLVAGGRYELYSNYSLQMQAVAASVALSLGSRKRCGGLFETSMLLK